MTNCEQTKVCTTCQEEKVISEFYNAERGKYGVKSKCKKCYNINKKKYYIKTKEKRLEYCRQYTLDNKEKIKEYNREYKKKKYREDPVFKVSSRMRRVIGQCIKRKKYIKKSKTQDILGCDFVFFKNYIQRQFKDGMTWDNYGEWHLDHIKPMATAKTEEQVLRLNHYTNFQPLWAKENIKKRNKIINKQLRFL